MRYAVTNAVALLASASEQLRYERTVPYAFVPGELFETASDLFQPKNPRYIEAFSREALCDVAHLYGLVCEASYAPVATVAELLKTPAWRRVMAVAKDLAARLSTAA